MLKAHAEVYGSPSVEWGAKNPGGLDLEIPMVFMSPEICLADERAVESQLLLFMRTSVLPVAIQTRALIIISGANDCYLGAALSEVVIGDQIRLGKDCPFTVIAMAYEFEVHYRAVRAGSLACQIAKQCPTWKSRLNLTSQFWKYDSGNLQQCDLSTAASHYIIFESIDEAHDETGSFDVKHSKTNFALRKSFETTFLHMMTRRLPSVAIQSHLVINGIQYLVDLTSLNIPVLLLDTRERAIISKHQRAKPSTSLATESNAFPSVSRETVEEILECDESALTLDSRREVLRIAEDIIEREWEVLINRGVPCDMSSSYLSYFHSALLLGSHIQGNDEGRNLELWSKIRDMERLMRTNKDSIKALIPAELLTRAIDFITTKSSPIRLWRD